MFFGLLKGALRTKGGSKRIAGRRPLRKPIFWVLCTIQLELVQVQVNLYKFSELVHLGLKKALLAVPLSRESPSDDSEGA